MYDRIVLTLDGFDLSEKAIPHAANLATALGSRLLLLRVVPEDRPKVQVQEMAPDEMENLEPLSQQMLDSVVVEAKDYLDRHAEALRKGGATVTTFSRIGRPAETILDFIEEQQAQLVLMATHGRSGIRRWAFGSIADRVSLIV